MSTLSTTNLGKKKKKRRGFVMTGGGAKGLYEAGVIHAFHLTGMEFDVITGSSIGAFNSIFFAEYLLKKKNRLAKEKLDPEAVVDAMDNMVKAYHHAWLQLPENKIIDDSETGPLGKLKDDLLEFNVNLPDLANILWWWTDPKRGPIPSTAVWPTLLKVGKEVIERLGEPAKVWKVLKSCKNISQRAIVTYLSRFKMDKSLVPADDDQKLSSILTNPIEPLQAVNLKKTGKGFGGSDIEKVGLVAPKRTLKDYADVGIDVRLTRANYRTGRLEVSAYLSLKDFVRYLQKQAFRVEKTDPEKIPLGSFRLQLPGNPDAIGAALASGRFPGVLAPFPIENIYLTDDPENQFLHKMLTDWLDDADVKNDLTNAFLLGAEDKNKATENWQKTYERWRKSESMRSFFPQRHDVYVDGGAIDNTPSNSAIDATREWIELDPKRSKRDYELELYVIFLHEEPRVEQAKVETPIFHEVVKRTLEIQGAAQQSSASVVVDTINSFGKRAEKLGDALSILLYNYQQHLQSLDENQRKEILDALQEQAKEAGLRGFVGQNGDGILERMADWTDELINQKLPLHINEVAIYPDEMPMGTLQFTERLGYRQEKAIQMLTMGCSNTLWAIFKHLGDNQDDLDEQDQKVMALTKKWTGLDIPPKDLDVVEMDKLRQNWKCKRTDCSFYKGSCSHGKRQH